jgi:hypothetical protein
MNYSHCVLIVPNNGLGPARAAHIDDWHADILTHLKVLELFHFPPTYPFTRVEWYVDERRHCADD